MGDITIELMRENISGIRAKIKEAAERSGREPKDVTLIGVSKFQPLESLYMALDCGITILGENRVQEREQKAASWAGKPAEWHMIGHLQRNKSRKALELFDCVQSVDSFELASALDKITAEKAGKDDSGLNTEPFIIMIEVNTSGEESKNGVSPDGCIVLAEKIINECPNLKVDGLMTIGPLAAVSETRRSFALLRSLALDIRAKLGVGLRHLSMGMSGDFEAAIEEGSTMVRIGTGIFGARR
ncbi:MAG: YggS family pyridoxal phosphate-dependent enzyme [Synergistaceae bacterium]|jgi:pyridoxal phosphate enzyme (YggS family)|nr:YggS family pyridoxal phosphate-dependent enzyme [Synergistaceae bacterium]